MHAGRDLVLATARLRLTTWLPEDVDALWALHRDPVVMRWMVSGLQDRDQVGARIRTWTAEHATRGWSKWRLTDADGRFLGRAGFGTLHDRGAREIGYLLAQDAWGHGYATEIATALVRWHLEHPDPAAGADLLGYALPGNAASRHVLIKAGFRGEGPDPDDPRYVAYRFPGTPA